MSDEWFGEAIARPDFVHSDLKEVITLGSVPNHTFKFFRNFSKGGKVTVSGSDECTNLACNAYARQKPITTELPEGEEGDTTETKDTSSGQTLVAGAVTACAIIAAMM